MPIVPSPMSGGLTTYKIQVDAIARHLAPALTEVGAIVYGGGPGKGPQEAGGGGLTMSCLGVAWFVYILLNAQNACSTQGLMSFFNSGKSHLRSLQMLPLPCCPFSSSRTHAGQTMPPHPAPDCRLPVPVFGSPAT